MVLYKLLVVVILFRVLSCRLKNRDTQTVYEAMLLIRAEGSAGEDRRRRSSSVRLGQTVREVIGQGNV
jgi:hypothetical protein